MSKPRRKQRLDRNRRQLVLHTRHNRLLKSRRGKNFAQVRDGARRAVLRAPRSGRGEAERRAALRGRLFEARPGESATPALVGVAPEMDLGPGYLGDGPRR